jgi:hypothetical protein
VNSIKMLKTAFHPVFFWMIGFYKIEFMQL